MYISKNLLLLLIAILAVTSVSNAAESSREANVSTLIETMNSDWDQLQILIEGLSDEEIILAIDEMNEDQALQFLNHLGERAKGLPFVEIMEGWMLREGKAIHIVSMPLVSLGYSSGAEGVEQFQADIGAEANGVLTMAQMAELTRRYTRTRDTKVLALEGGVYATQIDIDVGEGELTAKGTWLSESMSLAFPINTSQVICRQSEGRCYVVGAHVNIPDLESDEGTYYLESTFDSYSISSWTDEKIIATEERTCSKTTLTVHLSEKQVIETDENNWSEVCDGMPFASKLPEPHIKRLVPSYAQTYEFWQQRRETTKEFFSSEMRSTVEAWIRGSNGNR